MRTCAVKTMERSAKQMVRAKHLEDSAAACAFPMHGCLSTPLVYASRPPSYVIMRRRDRETDP